MSDVREKIALVEKEGFKYVRDRDIFCRPSDKKCFSLEYIEDNEIDIIKKKISEHPRTTGRIVYYFNGTLSGTQRNVLDKELKKKFALRDANASRNLKSMRPVIAFSIPAKKKAS